MHHNAWTVDRAYAASPRQLGFSMFPSDKKEICTRALGHLQSPRSQGVSESECVRVKATRDAQSTSLRAVGCRRSKVTLKGMIYGSAKIVGVP